MDINSPYVVVGAILIAFAVSIWFGTSSKPDDEPKDHDGHSHA